MRDRGPWPALLVGLLQHGQPLALDGLPPGEEPELLHPRFHCPVCRVAAVRGMSPCWEKSRCVCGLKYMAVIESPAPRVPHSCPCQDREGV